MTRAMSILSTQNDHTQQLKPTKADIAEPEQPSPQPEASHEAHREPSPLLGSPTRRITRSTSKVSASVEHMKIPEPDTQPQQGKGNPYPCTPAEQIIDPLTPASPEAQHVAINPNLNTNVQPSARNLLIQSEPTTVPPSSFTCADPQPRPNQHQHQPEPSTDPVQAIPSMLTNLDGDPNFANAMDKLHAWSEQPPSVRLQTLKSYFCRLIMQPDFLNLCKDIDGMWEGEILNARLARMS